jgi:hypothetical protein
MALDELLEQFGSEKSRAQFLTLCRQYYVERSRHEALEQAGLPFEGSRRAEIHNAIMEIVQKLSVHSGKRMPSRTEVGKMIMEWFRTEEGTK